MYCPRIAQNVASIARTVWAMGAELHLVGPFGFVLDKSKMARSSVGYWESLRPVVHVGEEQFWKDFDIRPETQLVFATKKGRTDYSEVSYGEDVALFFGNETIGIPAGFFPESQADRVVDCHIPTENVRCLNLGVSVAIFGFEVLRSQRVNGKTKKISVQSEAIAQ